MNIYLGVVSLEQWFSCLLLVLQFFFRNIVFGGNANSIAVQLLPGETEVRAGV